MKKVLFLATIFLISTSVFAQSGVQPNVVKVNPLGALFGSANLGYERALNEKTSVLIAPSFGILKSGGFKYTTYGLGLEYRLYFTGSAPKGTYVAPGAAFAFGTAKIEDSFDGSNDQKTNITNFSGKAVIGHQWIWSSGFVLDLNGGIQYTSYKFKDNSGFFDGADAFSGILPALGLSLGYNF